MSGRHKRPLDLHLAVLIEASGARLLQDLKQAKIGRAYL